MSRIAFFCIPAHGHTNPTLGVVKELVSRGHQVWYYSYEFLREKIESAGAVFVPCDEYNARQKLSPKDGARAGKDLAFSTKLLVDTTLALDDMVCRDMEKLQPDCIVADSMAVWGKAIALKLNIPFVSSTTTFAFNRHSARIMRRSPGETLSMILSMPKINKDIKRLQDKGYPISSVLDILQNDDNTHTIVYTSPQFQPCAETFSDKYAFVGPSIRPAEKEIQKTREKLIYISMGTVNNDMLPFYKNCIAAFADGEHQVIMSTGQNIDQNSLGTLTYNISTYSAVDQIAVLQKADVFISHCGMNSASESLYFGVPLVMYPQTTEQGGVAERIRQLGAGLMLKDVSPRGIRAAAEELLAGNAYKQSAEAVAAGFRACPGGKGAADKILEMCRK